MLAVDPVAGGGKVTAQARAWDWPAVVGADELDPGRLDEQLRWCLSPAGRAAAEERAAMVPSGFEQLDELVGDLLGDLSGEPGRDADGEFDRELGPELLEAAETRPHRG